LSVNNPHILDKKSILGVKAELFTLYIMHFIQVDSKELNEETPKLILNFSVVYTS
jgi:hypothetical protein